MLATLNGIREAGFAVTVAGATEGPLAQSLQNLDVPMIRFPAHRGTQEQLRAAFRDQLLGPDYHAPADTRMW